MATTGSYKFVCLEEKVCVLVNVPPGGDVDEVLIIDDGKLFTYDDYPNINIDDFKAALLVIDNCYATYRMEFTANHGSVVTAKFFGLNEEADKEYFDEAAMVCARLVLWYESERATFGLSMEKFLEQRAIKTRRFMGKEKEADGNGDGADDADEVCAICLQEYKAEEMIGTLECKHSYHHECINKWLRLHTEPLCPFCRFDVFTVNFPEN